MSQKCFVDEACDFMYYCSNGVCKHQQLFPLQLYPALVYLLIPIACGLCNLSGNSMGMFKIMILMNLLRYTIGDATAIIQAVVVGAALPNFIQILKERHPNGKTSLVNFNLVLIFIPCCLYGSTLGSLMQNILPEFIQDAMIFGLFAFFSINYVKKARLQFQPVQQQKRQSLITTQGTRQSVQMHDEIQNRLALSINDQIQTQTSQQIQIQGNRLIPKKLKKSKKSKKKSPKDPQIIILKKQVRKYEQSLHARDILESLVVFLLFQCLVFFVQGKIPYLQFSKCTIYYPLGILLLSFSTIMYLFVVKKQMIQRFQQYRKVKFNVEIDLTDNKIFWKLVLGGLGAGFVQGTLGVGSGTFLMTLMLAMNINPRVAAATSGYEIMFTGSAALTEQFINQEITVNEGVFFFLWTAIAGGVVTFIMYRALRQIEEKRMKKILFTVIAILCIISLILILPVTIQRIQEEGWDYMFKAHFQC